MKVTLENIITICQKRKQHSKCAFQCDIVLQVVANSKEKMDQIIGSVLFHPRFFFFPSVNTYKIIFLSLQWNARKVNINRNLTDKHNLALAGIFEVQNIQTHCLCSREEVYAQELNYLFEGMYKLPDMVQ